MNTDDVDVDPGDGRDETENERLDRNWNEMLQELRVIQTGTQILTGFLLAAVFQSRFDDLDDYDAMSQFAQGVPTQLLAIIFPDERERSRFLRECCADENGKVRFTLAMKATTEIFEALGAGN